MKADGRRELKYQISGDAALSLEKTLPLILRRDPHAGPEGRYRVRSLYFDDWDVSAFTEKLAGVERRAKYRLRYYGDAPEYLVYEVKEKLGDLCRKRSERVTLRQAEAMEAGLDFPAETPLLREFQILRESRRLVPAVIVEYDRAPFVLDASRTRVTLDLDVRAVSPSAGFLSGKGAALPVLEPGAQVQEVKSDEFLPLQAALALGDTPKQRTAVSKYCMCLAALQGHI